MTFLIDVVLMLIVAAAFFIGMKRGFFKALIDMFSTVIAVVITFLTYRSAASFINDRFILPKITEKIKNLITSNGTVTDIAKLFSEKKSFFTAIIDRFSNMDAVENYYNGVKDSGNAVDKVSEFMASPIAETISRLIAFIVVLLISLAVMKLIAALIGMTLRLPLLKQADSMLGAVFGAAIGIIIAWSISLVVVNSFDSLMALSPKLFPEGKSAAEIIDSTLLLRFLSGVSPQAVMDMIRK